ncbi:hypothetical protein [Brucella anthropi]|uniref:hypothetical protein n=1 Tax=Brucella anthropi TaxID=529 RepID=UPI003D9854AE
MNDAQLRLSLIAYYCCVDHGYVLPLYGQSEGANTLYVAQPAVPGDHTSHIAAFELIDVDDLRRLPAGESLSVAVGESWRDVFIWNGTAYVGTPTELWKELTPFHADVMSRAPLSLLDLAVNAHRREISVLGGEAMSFVRDRFGEARARSWRRQFLRERAETAFRRDFGGEKLADEIFREIHISEESANVLSLVLAPELRNLSMNSPAKASISALSQLAAFMGASIDLAPAARPAEPKPVSTAMPSFSPAEETAFRGDGPVLIIGSGKRAREIVRHLKTTVPYPDPGIEILTARPGQFPDIADSSVRSIVAFVLDEDENPGGELTADARRFLERQAATGALVMIVPALPLKRPSELFHQHRILSLASGHTVLDTSIARSPFWWGNPKRSLDRRVSDIIQLAIAAGRSLAVRRELLPASSGGKSVILSVGTVPSERPKRSRPDQMDELPLGSEASWVSADPKRNDRSIMFSLRLNAGELDGLFGGEQIVVEGRQPETRFSEFAIAVIASLINRGRRRTTDFGIGIEERRTPPAAVSSLLRSQDHVAALQISTGRSVINLLVTGETPTLEAVHLAQRSGWEIARYTDSPTLRRLLTASGPPTFPDEIDIGSIRSVEANKNLAARGVDLRDVVRVSFDVLSEWLDRLPESNRAFAREQVRPLRTGSRPYGDASNDHLLRREFVLSDRQDARLLIDILRSHPGRFPVDRPMKRSSDLEKCWTHPREFKRYALIDGLVPGIVLELQQGEVPSQEMFVIDGDVAVPALFRSRVFAVWARATLPPASSWMSRFSVTSTFGGFPIPEPFRILRLGADSSALVAERAPSSLRQAVEQIDQHVERMLSGLAPENWREAHRLAQDNADWHHLDEFVLGAYELPVDASDLQILGRLLELNASLE